MAAYKNVSNCYLNRLSLHQIPINLKKGTAWMNFKAVDIYLQKIKNGSNEINRNIHDSDVAEYLETIKEKDEKKFFNYLNSLPVHFRALTFMQLPTSFQFDLIIEYDAQGLREIIEELESDEATDLFIAIEKIDKEKSEKVFSLMKDTTQKNIEKLISYTENEAGSLMKTELFKVSVSRSVDYALKKLKKLKSKGIGTVQNLFITDERGIFLKSIAIDDFILEDKDKTFDQIIQSCGNDYCVTSHDSLDEVIIQIEKYEVLTMAVLDRIGHLIGIITYDDIIRTIQNKATSQIYTLNNIDKDEEIQESFIKTTKNRGKWLALNLLNVTLASIVIGVFEDVLNSIVALAVLMPIVANMAGTSASQTMTVIVRQIGLGEVDSSNLPYILKKEVAMAGINGIVFGILTAVISYIRYEDMLVSLSIALAMFFSFLSAGTIGASIPMLLKRLNIDPAIASSIFVLTIVDIIGFFSFLWLAKIIIV